MGLSGPLGIIARKIHSCNEIWPFYQRNMQQSQSRLSSNQSICIVFQNVFAVMVIQSQSIEHLPKFAQSCVILIFSTCLRFFFESFFWRYSLFYFFLHSLSRLYRFLCLFRVKPLRTIYLFYVRNHTSNNIVGIILDGQKSLILRQQLEPSPQEFLHREYILYFFISILSASPSLYRMVIQHD